MVRPYAAHDQSTAPAGSVIGAAVDVGSNSVHSLVGFVTGEGVLPIEDQSVLSGLGAIVDRFGRLPRAARDGLVDDLRRYRDRARELGASRVTFVGTEPLRRAANADAVAAAVLRATGVPLEIVTPEEEGLLTLLGVTRGRPVRAPLLVADVGGGSTEFVIAAPGKPLRTSGVSLGSTRLTDRHVRHDPVLREELDAMRLEVRERLAAAPEARITKLVLVGGSASNLLRIHPTREAAGQPQPILDRPRLARVRRALLREPTDVIAARFGVRLVRARTLAAGALAIGEILDRYGVRCAGVSEEGLRDGLVLAAAAAGDAWRDELPRLVDSAPHDADREEERQARPAEIVVPPPRSSAGRAGRRRFRRPQG